MDVVGAADASLQHATAPNGNVEGRAKIVDAFRLQVATHTPDLDVDDTGSITFQCFSGMGHGTIEILLQQLQIEADRRIEPLNCGVQPLIKTITPSGAGSRDRI